MTDQTSDGDRDGWGSGSSGGRRLSLADYVMGTVTPRGATAAGRA